MKRRYILLACIFLGVLSSTYADFNIKYKKKNSDNTLYSASTITETSQKVNAFITLKDRKYMQEISNEYGVKFNVGNQNTFTALLPIAHINQLSNDSRVLSVQTSSPIVEMTDLAKRKINLEEAFEGIPLSSSYKGNGVIIGIIDTGFDYTHPNFKDEQGTCRIKNVWQQNGTIGGTPSPYGYGNVLSSEEEILKTKFDTRYDTHGTHVTGIATGSGNNIYKGIAPKADIVLVSTNKTEQGIVDGLAYLVQYAEKQNKPIAINISIGTMLGYKDGSGTMARLIDEILASRKGCIAAIAMGNEGHRNSTLKGNNIKSIIEMSQQGSNQVFIEGEKGIECNINICLKNIATGAIVFSQDFNMAELGIKKYTDFGTTNDQNENLYVECKLHEITQKPSMYLSFAYTKDTNEEWIISIEAKKGTPTAYCNIGSFVSKGIKGYSDGTSASTMAMTAAGHYPISVGAIVTKNNWVALNGDNINKEWEINTRYPLSAKGPTSDGRIKPDIVAPGAAIVSSFSSYTNYQFTTINTKTDRVYTETHNGRQYHWGVESGTSMATPIVTGVIALMLEANPNLTADEAKRIIQNSAQKAPYMGILPNNEYGSGCIDALESMKMVLATNTVEALQENNLGYIYDKEMNKIWSTSDAIIEVYDINGVLLRRSETGNITLPQKQNKVLILKIQKGNHIKHYKISL